MANNVDPNRVIQRLVTALANTQAELAMTQVALEDANAVISKHGIDEPSTDAT